jgi:hypothetical protein
LSNARGIDIQTTTTLIKGEVIKILVGQRGSWQGAWTYMGSGGGGSFVVRENSTPIIIAGGGGGTGGGVVSYVNSDASIETYGMSGSSNIDSYGTNGGGGKGGQGSGGGGFLQGGFAGINNSIPPSSFLTGGVGGLATGGTGAGGFGGGGYAHDTSGFQTGGGGGGGYSGGGGGAANDPGGGGGSFAISTMTVNGYNTGHGSVTITLNSPSSDFDVSGVSRLSASSATATALTTVGRIGVNTAAPTADLDVTGVSRLSASSATATALTTTGRIGVNTAAPTVDLEVNGLAKIGGNVIIGASPLYAFTSHTFTNAGATGRTGPTLSTVRNHSSYASVSWAQNNSYLSMTGDNGIQLWTVPVTGNYTIRAKGAGGGGEGNGKGRDIQLTTILIKGEVIRILVGQQGSGENPWGYGQASGGGGTFVVRDTRTPIIVAGGGGGRGYAGNGTITAASSSRTGINSGGAGGTNGQGGASSADGGGGGMFGNGEAGGGSEGGLSFINGGLGGLGVNGPYQVNGGFGGGGGGYAYGGGGGGGGYSGGGGGGGYTNSMGGGGGGSYGITTLTDYDATNTTHGSVTIALQSPSYDFDVAGALTISGYKPRISVSYTTNLRTWYSIPQQLRSGNFITNKVYFSIRLDPGNRNLYLLPNGSATHFHSYTQQFTSAQVYHLGDNTTNGNGFRICQVIGASSGGFTTSIYTHIVGEFTIIRNTVGHTSTIGGTVTTRIYGTLVQYGNAYIQKWDFQGQAINGSANDSYDRIDSFQFLTENSSLDLSVNNSVAVTIEGD